MDCEDAMECTLTNSADDTKLKQLNVLKNRDAIQRNLDRPEECACCHSMKFNKVRCKAMHLGTNNSWQHWVGTVSSERPLAAEKG